MDKKYTIVIMNFGDQFYGFLPDFTLSCTELTRELAVEKLLELSILFVTHANSQGRPVPNPTPEKIIRDKWEGYDFETITIKV